MNIRLPLNKEQQSIFGYWLRRKLRFLWLDNGYSNEKSFLEVEKEFSRLSGFDITLKYFMRDLRGIAGYLDLKAC